MLKEAINVLLVGLIAPVFALPSAGPSNRDKANAVKEAFQISWRGYYKYAFPNDNLLPATNGFNNDRNGWGVTPVDSLSTAIVLEDKAIVQQILEFIPTIDFTTTKVADESISVFETNIRYLGGLISAYDLLKGPYKGLAKDAALVEALLDQAIVLGDSLSVAFKTPSGVPDPLIFLNPAPRINGSTRNNIAEVGTLVLEWTRLTDLTGDPKYARLAQKAEAYMIRPTGSPEAFPGLVGTYLNIKDGKFIDSNGGWSGLTDSFYEYLIKMYLYDPKEFAEYKERWVLAAESTMQYLASHPSSRSDLTFLSQYRGTKTLPFSGHLASFAAGNFILGGILLGEEKYKQFGLKLTESYYQTYSQTATGIGPEGFRWFDASLPVDQENRRPPPEQALFYQFAGFWANSPGYILRPETMESIYYAYRLTGDPKYQDFAWTAFNRIKVHCRVGGGYAGITDVTAFDGGQYINQMQSFFLAETLKYLWLIFADDSAVHFQIDGSNEWVFNTEAHPVRVRS
ncbi:putative mannosyl-oligosaccharide alpha-1,2-mannosidase 1B [Paramyrothecium foliicola]|nr:putative mannosyl-oligosaccharide alpha-1,2-mannosidase 1B [Paramyrothecium foliicola]